MKTISSLIFTMLALSFSLASAETVNCPNVGKILMNADVAYITYAPRMGFTDNADIAYFISMGQETTEYRASKWGALISIPNALLSRQVTSANVTFSAGETPPQLEACTID